MPTNFVQEMTNNMRFTSRVGDTNTGSLQLVLNKTNIIGDTKYNIKYN